MPLTSRNVDLCAVLRIAFRRNRRRTFLFIIYFKWLFWICLSIVSARWCSHWRTISALYDFDLRPAVGVGLEHIKIWAFLESLMKARQFLGSRKVNILSEFWIVNSDILAAWITPDVIRSTTDECTRNIFDSASTTTEMNSHRHPRHDRFHSFPFRHFFPGSCIRINYDDSHSLPYDPVHRAVNKCRNETRVMNYLFRIPITFPRKTQNEIKENSNSSVFTILLQLRNCSANAQTRRRRRRGSLFFFFSFHPEVKRRNKQLRRVINN